MRKVWVEKNTYRDSVSLMHLASQIEKIDGVLEAAILMGTPANLARLANAGYADPSLGKAGIGDLCIGVNASDPPSMETAENAIHDFLSGVSSSRSAGVSRLGVAPKTIASAMRQFPSANLAAISAPGEYAGREARLALEQNLHVFLFSDNVALDEEIQLKSLAREKGLLFMGPDCGTALIHGTPLGFCNRVDPGPVGLVAASGTGAQEICCLLAARGVGISQIIGTGGRDLSKAVAGATSIIALQALARDPQTQVIVIVSKPPDAQVQADLREKARQLGKPVVICFISEKSRDVVPGEEISSMVFDAETLAHAADLAAALVQKTPPPQALDFEQFVKKYGAGLDQERAALAPAQKFVRGLYSGGTLADETAILLASFLENVHAGEGFGRVLPIHNWEKSADHTVIDLGDDRFTKGRPHPMIDSGIRIQRIQAESQDPEVTAILLDIVLGSNADPDPASSLAPAIHQAKETALKAGRYLPFVVHICGVENDPQDLQRQIRLIQEAGCLVFPSNAEAAFAAAYLAGAKIQR